MLQVFFCFPGQLTGFFILSLVIKLHFISQPPSKSTLPFAGLQHMQKCQANLYSNFLLPYFNPNEWCRENGLHNCGLNPRPLSHESSALTTRPRLLVLFQELLIVLNQTIMITCCLLFLPPKCKIPRRFPGRLEIPQKYLAQVGSIPYKQFLWCSTAKL